jgi:vancomycin resistance protein VanW
VTVSSMSTSSMSTASSMADLPPLPAALTNPPRLSQRQPWLYPIAVRVHRARRRVQWWRSPARWSRTRSDRVLPVRIKKHGSLLMRELSEDEMILQRNKVVNLSLASDRMNGILIAPGETLSFNKVVGNCTRRRGYVDGMRLSNGSAQSGVGGGICQLANLVHWMVLHSPLTVVERSEHSFDPFPDKGRVLPWGVGCSIVYNYVDLCVRNDTDRTFQILVHVGKRHLKGELRADLPVDTAYSVYARDEHFWRRGTDYFRSNQIWRDVIDRRTGNDLRQELIRRNCARVVYEPVGVHVIDVPETAGDR